MTKAHTQIKYVSCADVFRFMRHGRKSKGGMCIAVDHWAAMPLQLEPPAWIYRQLIPYEGIQRICITISNNMLLLLSLLLGWYDIDVVTVHNFTLLFRFL